jgi:hypothetical protein
MAGIKKMSDAMYVLMTDLPMMVMVGAVSMVLIQFLKLLNK